MCACDGLVFQERVLKHARGSDEMAWHRLGVIRETVHGSAALYRYRTRLQQPSCLAHARTPWTPGRPREGSWSIFGCLQSAREHIFTHECRPTREWYSLVQISAAVRSCHRTGTQTLRHPDTQTPRRVARPRSPQSLLLIINPPPSARPSPSPTTPDYPGRKIEK